MENNFANSLPDSVSDMRMVADCLAAGNAVPQEVARRVRERADQALENHAERVILRNLPEGARVNRWGISSGAHQWPLPCPQSCQPYVVQAGGILEGA